MSTSFSRSCSSIPLEGGQILLHNHLFFCGHSRRTLSSYHLFFFLRGNNPKLKMFWCEVSCVWYYPNRKSHWFWEQSFEKHFSFLRYPPWKLRYPMKIDGWKMTFHLNLLFFRAHLPFRTPCHRLLWCHEVFLSDFGVAAPLRRSAQGNQIRVSKKMIRWCGWAWKTLKKAMQVSRLCGTIDGWNPAPPGMYMIY